MNNCCHSYQVINHVTELTGKARILTLKNFVLSLQREDRKSAITVCKLNHLGSLELAKHQCKVLHTRPGYEAIIIANQDLLDHTDVLL